MVVHQRGVLEVTHLEGWASAKRWDLQALSQIKFES